MSEEKFDKVDNFFKVISYAKDGDNYKDFLISTLQSFTMSKILKLQKEIKKLIHHRDSTVGLWATDQPNRIPEDLTFQITY